jgi:hypothetical protein
LSPPSGHDAGRARRSGSHADAAEQTTDQHGRAANPTRFRTRAAGDGAASACRCASASASASSPCDAARSPLDEVLTEIGELERELEDLIETSPLPADPDNAAVDAFLVQAYREHWDAHTTDA